MSKGEETTSAGAEVQSGEFKPKVGDYGLKLHDGGRMTQAQTTANDVASST